MCDMWGQSMTWTTAVVFHGHYVGEWPVFPLDWIATALVLHAGGAMRTNAISTSKQWSNLEAQHFIQRNVFQGYGGIQQCASSMTCHGDIELRVRHLVYRKLHHEHILIRPNDLWFHLQWWLDPSLGAQMIFDLGLGRIDRHSEKSSINSGWNKWFEAIPFNVKTTASMRWVIRKHRHSINVHSPDDWPTQVREQTPSDLGSWGRHGYACGS